MTITEEMRSRLTAAFAPTRLEIDDESEAHRGHSGYREGGESHFRILMRAPALAGLGRVARHRAGHAALGPELVGRIHALVLDLDG